MALEFILTLCFVDNQEEVTNKQQVLNVISLNLILSYWTISEHWMNNECKVNALWTHGEREESWAEIASECTVSA